MKILLLGASGQLGLELSRNLTSLGEVRACQRNEIDLADETSIVSSISAFEPDVIVNAAAYTAVDKAESDRELALKVNAEGVGVLAREASRLNSWLIHYSTDYVFDGTKTEPYLETDPPAPVNVYGESKLAGEKAIASSGCKHLIFRTTWVIGHEGNNFAKTILRLAAERDSLNVINDQIGVPTTPGLITEVTMAAIREISKEAPWPAGIYNLTPRGQTSWFGVAQALLNLAKDQSLKLSVDRSSLHPIATSEYPTPAKRPANSLLDTNKLEGQLQKNLPHWEDDFTKTAKIIIKELKGT